MANDQSQIIASLTAGPLRSAETFDVN